MCLKCCFYIAAIFHFGLLSLNCLWGFVRGEEPSHLYMRWRKGRKREVGDLFVFSFIFLASLFLSACRPFLHSFISFISSLCFECFLPIFTLRPRSFCPSFYKVGTKEVVSSQNNFFCPLEGRGLEINK